MKILPVLLSCSLLTFEWRSASQSIEPIEGLTLTRALDLATRMNPELAEARARVEAAAQLARHAGALPDPEFITGVESAPLNGRGDPEYLAGLGLTVPLGGRLERAREAGSREAARERATLDLKWRQVQQRIHSAHAAALYQEQAARLQTDLEANLAKTLDGVRARVAAGDAVSSDAGRAEMELARARLEMRRADSLRARALADLASAIGDANLSVRSVNGELEPAFSIPVLESIAAELEQHPAWRLADAELSSQRARVALTKAERVPDIRVELLYRRDQPERRDAIDLGISVPLPWSRAGRGRIQAAEAEARAVEARTRVMRNELQRDLRAAQMQMADSLGAYRVLKDEIVPRAEAVLRAAEARYSGGDISLADLLPSRRDWAEVRMDELEALRTVMESWVELKAFLADTRFE